MTKKNKNKITQPLVSVCTPTFNRRPFIQMMFECFKNQTYPKDKIEWIIIDDGTDKIKDLVNSSGISQIKYFALPEKITLGAKRNLMHEKSTGSIIVYMDDDDYYPPERISHAVEMLLGSKTALCAGSSELYVFYKHIQKMYKCGPYGPTHATAGTFAFKRELLKLTRYNDEACLAEEREFLKGYTIPMVQLDPMKTILVFSHDHNTFDKKKLLNNIHTEYFRESDKTVDMFIKYNDEAKIKKFFLTDIDEKLAKYAPGSPTMKPDVIEQTKEIEEKRKTEAAKGSGSGLLLQQEGKEPVSVSLEEIVKIINMQNQTIQTMKARTMELETIIENLQMRKLEPVISKLEPEIAVQLL